MIHKNGTRYCLQSYFNLIFNYSSLFYILSTAFFFNSDGVRALRVDEQDVCGDGLYFDVDKDDCQYCLRCPRGYQPKQACQKDWTDSECEVCPVGTFSAQDDSWMSCESHTSCTDKHRALHAVGNSITDNVCGTCLVGYTELEASSGVSFCWACSSVENPPPECEGYIDKENEEIDQKQSTESPEESSTEDTSTKKSGVRTDDTRTTDNTNNFMLLLLLLCFGFFILIAMFVLIALLIIRMLKGGSASPCEAFCPLPDSARKQSQTRGREGVETNRGADTIVLPEIIVAQHPGRNMYSRQLSDTIVQLKLFELRPSDIVSSANDTSSNDDLLELLSARSRDEQAKWKVQMVHKIYQDGETWSLPSEVKQKLIGYYLMLDKGAQVQLGRALVDVFKVETHSRKMKMDELLKLVMNNPSTTVYKLVLTTFQNCMDVRVLEAICDELFQSRKLAQKNNAANLDTIQEANA